MHLSNVSLPSNTNAHALRLPLFGIDANACVFGLRPFGTNANVYSHESPLFGYNANDYLHGSPLLGPNGNMYLDQSRRHQCQWLSAWVSSTYRQIQMRMHPSYVFVALIHHTLQNIDEIS